MLRIAGKTAPEMVTRCAGMIIWLPLRRLEKVEPGLHYLRHIRIAERSFVFHGLSSRALDFLSSHVHEAVVYMVCGL